MLRAFAIVCVMCISPGLLTGAGEADARGYLSTSSDALARSSLHSRANAQPAPASVAAPATCEIGVYFLSLHNFSFDENSFDATFWLWINCPDTMSDPLDTLELVNVDASNIERTVGLAEQATNGTYIPMKASGTFRHNWDLTDFPFDQHTLEIIIEDLEHPTSELVYVPDKVQSGYHPRTISSDAWTVTDFFINASPYTYNTTFGDPDMSPGNTSSDYSRLRATITIERTAYTGFLELTSVVYIAFLLSLISFLIRVDSASDLGTRLALVSGALFATAINLQVTTTQLGDPSALSLVDEIHLSAFAAIFFAAIVAIASRILLDLSHSAAKVRRLNYMAMAFSTVAFLASNLVLINSAAHFVQF